MISVDRIIRKGIAGEKSKSRVPLVDPESGSEDEEESACDFKVEIKMLECLTANDWKLEQDRDPVIFKVKQLIIKYPEWVPEEALVSEPHVVKAYMHLYDDLRLIQEVLVKEVVIPSVEQVSFSSRKYRTIPTKDLRYQKVVPRHMTLCLFRVWHCRPEQGHLCYKRVYPVMRDRSLLMGMA